ncbi:hypothetical protein P389DRAFT_168790 [Cystobasidium minutum MCA 4210]|uniref:uncharacterized protein n=1 Tax=Cystobasidium minutum MCA 4210 TaxID=1397322 RepID=UPI0034CF3999|eukprot:jgi/Rhomi1/168790/fgenesh1_kg.3_\
MLSSCTCFCCSLLLPRTLSGCQKLGQGTAAAGWANSQQWTASRDQKAEETGDSNEEDELQHPTTTSMLSHLQTRDECVELALSSSTRVMSGQPSRSSGTKTDKFAHWPHSCLCDDQQALRLAEAAHQQYGITMDQTRHRPYMAGLSLLQSSSIPFLQSLIGTAQLSHHLASTHEPMSSPQTLSLLTSYTLLLSFS